MRMNGKLIITINLFFLSLLLSVSVLLPRYQKLKIIQAIMESDKNELRRQKQHFSQIEQTYLELQKYKDSLDKIDSALPSFMSLPDVYYFLKKSSEQSGLILTDIGCSSPVVNKSTGVKTYSISFHLSGSYSAFKSFIPILENSARLIDIEDINFHSPPPESSFSFGMRIKVNSL